MKKGIQRVRAVVRGRVQGVGFRFFVKENADGLGLSGWVSNMFNGDVEIEVEGPAAALNSLKLSVEQGPPMAVVDQLIWTMGYKPEGSSDFTII